MSIITLKVYFITCSISSKIIIIIVLTTESNKLNSRLWIQAKKCYWSTQKRIWPHREIMEPSANCLYKWLTCYSCLITFALYDLSFWSLYATFMANMISPRTEVPLSECMYCLGSLGAVCSCLVPVLQHQVRHLISHQNMVVRLSVRYWTLFFKSV